MYPLRVHGGNYPHLRGRNNGIYPPKTPATTSAAKHVRVAMATWSQWRNCAGSPFAIATMQFVTCTTANHNGACAVGIIMTESCGFSVRSLTRQLGPPACYFITRVREEILTASCFSIIKLGIVFCSRLTYFLTPMLHYVTRLRYDTIQQGLK